MPPIHRVVCFCAQRDSLPYVKNPLARSTLPPISTSKTNQKHLATCRTIPSYVTVTTEAKDRVGITHANQTNCLCHFCLIYLIKMQRFTTKEKGAQSVDANLTYNWTTSPQNPCQAFWTSNSLYTEPLVTKPRSAHMSSILLCKLDDDLAIAFGGKWHFCSYRWSCFW